MGLAQWGLRVKPNQLATMAYSWAPFVDLEAHGCIRTILSTAVVRCSNSTWAIVHVHHWDTQTPEGSFGLIFMVESRVKWGWVRVGCLIKDCDSGLVHHSVSRVLWGPIFRVSENMAFWLLKRQIVWAFLGQSSRANSCLVSIRLAPIIFHPWPSA